MSQDTRKKFFELARKSLEEPRNASSCCAEAKPSDASERSDCCQDLQGRDRDDAVAPAAAP